MCASLKADHISSTTFCLTTNHSVAEILISYPVKNLWGTCTFYKIITLLQLVFLQQGNGHVNSKQLQQNLKWINKTCS